MDPIEMDGKDISEDLLGFAQDLVRIQSISGQEGEVVRRIAAQMEALGFDDVRIDHCGSVLGRVGCGEKSILFDSHVDTVEVTDPDLWEVPPFSGRIADGFLWGRGSVDMKSGAAASIYAAALAKRANALAGKTVYVSCTVDEEYCDGEALGRLIAEFELSPDLAVVCEPSSNLITLGHKGKAQVVITTQGVSAHGSAPEKGVNAVYEMAEIIQRIEQRNHELSGTPGPHGTLVLSQISSTSVSLNAVPSACAVYLDRRMVRGETEAAVRAEMDRLVAGKHASWEIGALHRQTWTGAQLVYQPFHLAWEISPEHELSMAFRAACSEIFGKPPDRYDYWDFSTNAVALVRLGIPTIGFGPGEHKLAHMRNERCPTSQIVEACAVYNRVISGL